MYPKVLFAFPVIRSMWEFQDRPLEMSTPKYLALVTTSRIWPCKVYTVLIAFLAVVTRTTWHLEGLNSMSHWDSHNDSLSRSFCSTVPSSKPPIVRYTAVSSAKSRTCDDNFSGRSFMKTRNRIGHGITLQLTKNAKYLGIQISDDLAWSKHINQMTTKSNNTLKFIKRNIQTNIHKIKETAYKTYVRPLLEYSATVWDPWQKKYINQIEMVQHRAIRYIFNDYNFTSSVSSMLNQLALPTLEKRRKIASLSMFYKINHGLVRIKFPDYIKPTLRNRFSIPYSRIDAHRHSFFPRTARLWNDLPPDLINRPALETFRAGIDQYLH